MSNPDALRAALALAALTEQDRAWMLAQLSESARQRLLQAQSELDGEDLATLAARCGAGSEAVDASQQDRDLLADAEQVVNLLKHEPVWVRHGVLACFSAQDRRRLLPESTTADQPDYPALPSALKAALLSSLHSALDAQPTERIVP